VGGGWGREGVFGEGGGTQRNVRKNKEVIGTEHQLWPEKAPCAALVFGC